jgi:hypothetical protein
VRRNWEGWKWVSERHHLPLGRSSLLQGRRSGPGFIGAVAASNRATVQHSISFATNVVRDDELGR